MRAVTLSLLFLMAAVSLGCSSNEPTPTSQSITQGNRVPNRHAPAKAPQGQ